MSEQDGAIIIDFVRARMERLAQNALEELNLCIRDASSLDFFYDSYGWIIFLSCDKSLVIR